MVLLDTERRSGAAETSLRTSCLLLFCTVFKEIRDDLKHRWQCHRIPLPLHNTVHGLHLPFREDDEEPGEPNMDVSGVPSSFTTICSTLNVYFIIVVFLFTVKDWCFWTVFKCLILLSYR